MPYKNIDPKLWGPSLWTFLHYLTISYPDNPTADEQENVYNFLASMQKIIPCEKCRYNFNKHLDDMKVEVLTSKTEFVKWLHNIHNMVNKNNGAPHFSYDEFIDKYSNNGVNNEVNKINKINNNIIEKNKNLVNTVLTLNKQIEPMNGKLFSINRIIIGCILLLIIVIVIINKKSTN